MGNKFTTKTKSKKPTELNRITMPRVNDKTKREKDEIRKQLTADYGDGCLICGAMDGELYREIYKKELDIHHINEDSSDWAYCNLCLAHFWCNIKETPHGKIDFEKQFQERCKQLKFQKMKGIIDRDTYIDDAGLRIDSLPLYRNVKLKPLAIIEFEKIIREKTQVEKDGLLDAMANASGLTQEKCGKYLKAVTNPHNGNYEELPKDADGKVFIRKRST